MLDFGAPCCTSPEVQVQYKALGERGKELWELKEERILENDCDQYCKLMNKSGNTRTEKYPLTLANKTHCNSKSNYSL